MTMQAMQQEVEQTVTEGSSYEPDDSDFPASLPARQADSKNGDAVQAGNPAGPVAAQIAARAYEIYETRGRQNGRDLEDWLEAEREVLSSPNDEVERPGRALAIR